MVDYDPADDLPPRPWTPTDEPQRDAAPPADPHETVDYIAAIAADPEVDRAALDSLGAPVVVVDENMRIVKVNKRAEIFFGYTKLQLLGEPIEILVPVAKREIHARVHTPRYRIFPQDRQMGSKLAEVTALTKHGTEIPVRISLSPFQVSRGRFFNAVVHLIDEVRG
jgi:PAS domain S-box-containing protein